MLERKNIIAVIGAGEPSAGEAKLAEEVGRQIARQGAALVCGGLGGIMEAACRGASSEGGAANPYVRVPIVTGIGYARNVAVVKSARAVIAVGGSYGTLSEIAHALQSKIPVIGLNTWALSRNGRQDESIITAKDPTEAVTKALTLAGV